MGICCGFQLPMPDDELKKLLAEETFYMSDFMITLELTDDNAVDYKEIFMHNTTENQQIIALNSYLNHLKYDLGVKDTPGLIYANDLEVEHNSYKIILPLPHENLQDFLDNYKGYDKIENYNLKIVTEAQQLEIDKIKNRYTNDRDIIIAINNYLLDIKRRRDITNANSIHDNPARKHVSQTPNEKACIPDANS